MKWPPAWLKRPAPSLAEREESAARGERAVTMGRFLRDQRVRAGLTPVDVERDTRINRVYIEALEDARFDVLPAPVYARGFMRSYAKYLGVDPEEAAAAVPRDLPPPAGLEPMPGLRRTAPPALPAVNAPVLITAGVALVLVVAALLIAPRLGGGDGLDVPEGTATATATLPPGSTSTAASTAAGPSATVAPFDEGTAPDFTGVSRAEAEAVLEEIGATPLIVESANDAPAGTVFDQSPAPGEDLQDGDVVTLFVSQGR